MRLSDLTKLLLALNQALDKYKRAPTTTVFSMAEVKKGIEEGWLFGMLEPALGAVTFFQVWSLDGHPEEIELIEAWRSFERSPDLLLKGGVENDGLHLLIAYTTKMIEQRMWTD
jgi:hypothetical protein